MCMVLRLNDRLNNNGNIDKTIGFKQNVYSALAARHGKIVLVYAWYTDLIPTQPYEVAKYLLPWYLEVVVLLGFGPAFWFNTSNITAQGLFYGIDCPTSKSYY